MAKLSIQPGATDVTLYLFIQDSSSTTGAGLTGLAYNTASLVCYYVRSLGTATALSLATQTVDGAHSDGGFVEVDSTNMPGVYRLDLSDAIVAASARSAVVMLKGASNMAPIALEIDLSSQVDVTALGGVAQSATDLKDFCDTGYDPSTHKVQGVVLTDTTTAVTNLVVKKNTALAGFSFVMTDSTNHNPADSLTVSGTVSLDGAAFGALTNSVSEIANGWYKVDLAAADVNGNVVALRFTASGADDLNLTIVTQA